MTKIKNTKAYPIKKYPKMDDIVIGSDSEKDGETVNFSFKALSSLLLADIAYTYSKSSLPLEPNTGDGYFLSNSITDFSEITTLQISKINLSGLDLSPLMDFMSSNVNNFILSLVNKSDRNIFAYFKIDSIVDSGDYFTYNVTLAPGNNYLGELIDKDVFSFAYDLDTSAGTLPVASETIAGIVQLATPAETIAGTNSTKAVHPLGLAAALSLLQELLTLTTTGNSGVATLINNILNIPRYDLYADSKIENQIVDGVTDKGASQNIIFDNFQLKADKATQINTTAPLQGGGPLSSSLTLTILQASAIQAGILSAADWIKFNSNQTSTLLENNIWVGNALNIATGVLLSGDANINSSGVLTNTGLYGKPITLANGFFKYNGTDWIFDNTTYATQADIDAIYQPDVLVSAVPPTRSVNTFTYPANQYQALINKTLRTNPAAFVTTIGVATANYKRVDLIYFKSDNTLAKFIGTEDLIIAQRPDVPANAVGVSFINVFGDVISDPTPITDEISIQDFTGTEKFKITDYLRFKGVSFDADAKALITDPLIPLSAFLDIVNGNDLTATLENANKPFKTFNGLINALPTTSGETYTIYITGGTVPITRQIATRNLRFIAYNDVALDFTNVMEADGVTDATNVFTIGAFANWHFENQNISIVSNFVGQKYFSWLVNDTRLSLTGTLNTLNWKSTSNSASRGGFYFAANTNLRIIYCVESPQDTSVFSVYTAGVPNLVIDNYIFGYGYRALTSLEGGLTLEIKNLIQSGSTTGINLFLGRSSSLKLGSIAVNVPVNIYPASDFITFNTVTSVNSKINLQGCYMVSGSVTGASYPSNVYLVNGQYFKNYSGLLSKLDVHANDVYFENCNITTDTYLAGRGYGSTTENCVHFLGFNSVKQIDTSQPLFKTSGIGNSDIKPILIDIVNLTTNATTYGIYTSYIKTQSTFKEKLNEVVIRNKIDIVNKQLSSTTKYIIDGNLVLLAGESIYVTEGGLDIGGYGFDTSSISKNVTGESIFLSGSGNSGNLVTKDISYYPGTGSVFNLTDATGGHAIELNDVNFQGVSGSSLGKFTGYRQFTGTTCGFYFLSDGLILEGNWSGFKLTNSNVIGFGGSGTLFKKGSATVFSNRFYIDLNLQIATGSKICDFADANFTNDKSFQVVNCYTKVNGVVDATLTNVMFPNITPYSSKAYFVNNIGIMNSNNTPYGIGTANMHTYTDDTAAAAGGIVQIGEVYIVSTTGLFKVRQV